MRIASCSCGKLTARVDGEPVRVSICHCHACQRRTGSVFGVQARFPADAVAIGGESVEYLRVGDAGGRARFHFCPACGATVYYLIEGMADVVAIPVGVFAASDFPAPGVSVYDERRHSWVALPDGIERFD